IRRVRIETRARQQKRAISVALQHLYGIRRHTRLDERIVRLSVDAVEQPENASFGYVARAEVAARVNHVWRGGKSQKVWRQLRFDHVAAQSVSDEEHDVALLAERGRRFGRLHDG